MVDGEVPYRLPGGQDQLLEEASLWFARMRGPDAEAYRPDFEAWLKRGAVHPGAYERAGRIFALGRFLAEEEKSSAKLEAANDDNRSWWRIAAVAASLLLMVGIGGLFGRGFLTSSSSPQQQIAAASTATGSDRKTFATDDGRDRTIRLSDGSTVTLAGGSRLSTLFDASKRELRLERGRARFEVAHEPQRAFIVFAGNGSVTARGTIFDVIVHRDNLVTVRLLRGAVDVMRPAADAAKAGKDEAVTRLVPGEELSFGLTKMPDLGLSTKSHVDEAFTSSRMPSPFKEFDGAPLSAVIAEANRSAMIPIRVGDPAVGELAVSGRFRVDDPDQVADRLASLFNLKIDRSRRDEIVLRSK